MNSNSENNYIKKIREIALKVVTNITVEPVIFFYAIGFGITTIISPSLYFDKICKVGSPIFGDRNKTWNDTVCDNLDNGNYSEEQEYVQKTYSTIHTVTMLLKVIPPIIFSLFVGPWSDKFGRRNLIILPLTGYIAYNLWFLINVIYFDELIAEYLMLEVFQYWPGGYMCLFMGSYSLISDHSSKESRTTRIAIFDFTFLGAMSIGMGISGKINTAYGPAAIYVTGCVCQSLALLYAIFCVKEYKLPNENPDNGIERKQSLPVSTQLCQQKTIHSDKKASLSSIMNLKYPKESLCAIFKKRDGGVRHVVVMLVFLFGLYALQCMGVKMISLSYARNEFVWESTDYFNEWWSSYKSVQTVLNCVSLGLVLPFLTHVVRLQDLTITAICLTSTLASLVCILLAKIPELLYLSAVIKLFSEMTTTTIRSGLTKIIGPQDIGKVFACVASVQAIVELFGPVYHAIYLGTIDWYPGFAYCVSAFVLIFMIVMTIYCRWFVSRWFERMTDYDTYTKANSNAFSINNTDSSTKPYMSSKQCTLNVV